MNSITRKLFIATNNKKCRIMLEKPLEALCFKADYIDSCEELKSVITETPYAVLIEASFCNSNWRETALEIKKTASPFRKIPLILFSHKDNFSKKSSFYPADCFIKFPFTSDELSNALKKSADKKSGKKKKILFVDDSTLIHKMVETTLSGEPVSMIHAYNGNEGIEEAKKNIPDLIITDIEMPQKNGYELCRILKNHDETHNIPIIIQSSLSSGYNFDKGFEAGADDYITKPLVSEELISRVRDFIFKPEKKRETVLVSDSSKLIRKMVIRGLQKQGFQALEAETSDDLFEIIKNESVDMFIISQVFRNTTGREIVRELRKKHVYKKTPVIMLSSREDNLNQRKNRSAGISDFIAKPFSMDRLLVSVEKNLAEYRFEKEKEALGLYISDAARDNAQKIAHSSSKLTMTAGAEHKTIIFTDIVGFTPVCEKLPAENVVSILNEYFDNVVEIINRNCGTLDKFIGDAVMAYYGGMENGALMAVNSGLEMLDYLKSSENPIIRKIKIRIGINSGEVIAGDIGSRYSRRDYTLIGDNVNTAQRLESAAPVNSILISESTYSLIKDNIEAEAVPPVKLKGKNRKENAYIVKAIKNLTR